MISLLHNENILRERSRLPVSSIACSWRDFVNKTFIFDTQNALVVLHLENRIPTQSPLHQLEKDWRDSKWQLHLSNTRVSSISSKMCGLNDLNFALIRTLTLPRGPLASLYGLQWWWNSLSSSFRGVFVWPLWLFSWLHFSSCWHCKKFTFGQSRVVQIETYISWRI